ncbi:hypothetical protein D9M69_675770 [compost metagenome]
MDAERSLLQSVSRVRGVAFCAESLRLTGQPFSECSNIRIDNAVRGVHEIEGLLCGDGAGQWSNEAATLQQVVYE